MRAPSRQCAPTRTHFAIGWASFVVAALVLALGSALVAIGPTPARAQGSAYVRVAEAAPAAPAVDFYLDGGATPLLANFKHLAMLFAMRHPARPRANHVPAATPADSVIQRTVNA